MRYLIITFFLLCMVTETWAVLPPPPVIKEMDIKVGQYLKNLYDYHNKMEVVTTNPNGNRNGTYGEVVVFLDAGAYKLYSCVSSPSGTSWQIVQTGTTATVNWGDVGGTLSNQVDLWAELLSKQDTISVTAPLVLTGTDISIPQSTSTADGYLTDGDWVKFNAKADYSFGTHDFYGTGYIRAGSYRYNIRVPVASDFITATDHVLVCSGAILMVLPTSSGSGQSFIIKNKGSDTVTLRPGTGDTIDGENTQSIYASSCIVVVDGILGEWNII